MDHELRRYVDDVKSDFNRQVELSELKNLRTQVEDAARSIEGEVKESMAGAQQALDSVRSDFESNGPAEPQPVTDWDKIYAAGGPATGSATAASNANALSA